MSLGCRTFWRSKIWAAAMMLAPVMVLSGCDDKAAGEQQAGAGTAVDVVQVMPQNVPLTFEFAAWAQGSKETEVRARVGGILLKRNYVEGARRRGCQRRLTEGGAAVGTGGGGRGAA